MMHLKSDTVVSPAARGIDPRSTEETCRGILGASQIPRDPGTSLHHPTPIYLWGRG